MVTFNSPEVVKEAVPHEQQIEKAIETGMDIIEYRLGTTLEKASAEDRIAVTKELLQEIEDSPKNIDRFVAEFYSGIRKMAELELDFKAASLQFNALHQ